MSRCIHVYSFVARNHGGIPFSGVCPFFLLFFCFLVRKIPFAGIELTSQRVRGLRGTSELPGRPVYVYISVLLHS